MPTHGSLTKAGKVRGQTPKIAPRNKKSPGPRRSNVRKYQRMLSGARNFDKRRRR